MSAHFLTSDFFCGFWCELVAFFFPSLCKQLNFSNLTEFPVGKLR